MAGSSPKRRNIEDDGAEIDSILNPARNYPRKRVAVAVSIIPGANKRGALLTGRVGSAKFVVLGKRNVVRSSQIQCSKTTADFSLIRLKTTLLVLHRGRH